MPNIYLRLPRSRCQFFRNRDPDHALRQDEPLVFNAYSHAFFVMRNSLTNAQALTQVVNTQCFSSQQWRNMTCGRDPTGKVLIMNRNREDYPSFEEVVQLCSQRDYKKSMNEDYLCIKLPNEVLMVDRVRTVTPSWNLDKHGVRKMTELLNNDFKRSIIEWALSTFDFCVSNGRVVCRSQSSMLERYMMRYGIEPTHEETDNLRRVIERWFYAEHNHFRAYSCFDLKYMDDNDSPQKVDEFAWE